MDSRSATQDLIASEAADWFVRLQAGDLAPGERTRFSHWLQRSPEHVEEYLAIAQTWGDSHAAVADYGTVEELLHQARHEDDNVFPLPATSSVRGRQELEPAAPVSRQLPWRALTAAAVATAMVVTGFWFVERGAAERRYVTGENEQLRISLQDGSVIYLNAHSEANVSLTDRLRRIELRTGEARFHVAKDPRRPFLAVTDRATVTALGTVFNIARGHNEVTVTVVEGKVEVRLAKAASRNSAVTQLAAGEEATVLHAGEVSKRATPDIEQVLSWSEHRLVFRSRRLDEVIGEFNRYNWPPIEIGDPQLTSLEISGAFRADDPESLLIYLQRHESMAIERRPDGSVVLHRKE